MCSEKGLFSHLLHLFLKQSIIVSLNVIVIYSILTVGPDGVLSLGRHTPKVDVAVYYQTLCPDSRTFFYKQLMPAYTKLSELMNVSLIPYGMIVTHETDEKIEFLCPHGPPECKGMEIHACAINIVPEDAIMMYIFCMIMDNWNALVIGEKCAKKLGVDWPQIMACVSSGKSTEYLLQCKQETQKLEPPITALPRVIINGMDFSFGNTTRSLIENVCLILEKFEPAECQFLEHDEL